MKQLIVIGCIGILVACNPTPEKKAIKEVSLSGVTNTSKWPNKLSEWQLFEDPLVKLIPNKNVFPYEINSTLFTDYAHKSRFIKLPKDSVMNYHPTETLKFPQGTILIKNFYYPLDFRKPEGERRILETRLLINGDTGWEAVPYIWNNQQTDATIELAGGSLQVEWIDTDGKVVNVNYSVPNQVQCKSCHERNGKFSPIGPSARQLNKDRQLEKWNEMNLLTGIEVNNIPKLSDYNNETATIEDRARAWLEINCAHCHNKQGPAKNTGLYLFANETDNYKLGIGKPPVAAGKGSGGLKYAIVPGDPENSILYYRIKSLDPGVMMPELGRKLEHKEGAKIIRKWIESMD